jgi:hypothetical protein
MSYGILRLVRDVFHVSGFVICDPAGPIRRIMLNQAAPLAKELVAAWRELLDPTQIAINSGEI